MQVWLRLPLYAVLAGLIAGSAGCHGTSGFSVRGTLVPEVGTVNLARLRGTRLYVPSASEEFPPMALVDGVTRVDEWLPGTGWELYFDGALVRSRYFDPDLDSASDEPIEWAGLRRNFRVGKEYAALGWAILELQSTHVIDAVIIHSVDTPALGAHQFGVRDVIVHYWDEPTQRWIAVVPTDGPRLRQHTVKGNLLPHLRVDFMPIRTDLVRVAIQWTNDTVITRSFTVMGRPEQYAQGTVRLTEIELLGVPETGDVQAESATQQFPERRAPVETDSPTVFDPETAAEAAMRTVASYARAYADHDIDALIATVAPDYIQDGEDARELRSRLSDTFNEFPHFDFRLTSPVLHDLTPDSAVISGAFWLRLMPLIPRAAEGTMTFVLSNTGDSWLIQRIETAPH